MTSRFVVVGFVKAYFKAKINPFHLLLSKMTIQGASAKT